MDTHTEELRRWTCTRPREIAQAAGVPVGARRGAGRRGRDPVPARRRPGRFFAARSRRSRAVRALRADGGRSAALLFDKPEFAHASPQTADCRRQRGSRRHCRHAHPDQHDRVAAGGRDRPVRIEPVTTRLVFIASPGPGGGGGGGGLRQKAPPPRAQRKGKSSLDSPIPVRKAPKPIEAGAEARAAATTARGEAGAASAGRCAGRNGGRERESIARSHRRAGAEGKREPRTWSRRRSRIGNRHRSRERRRFRHRRRIGRRDGRRSVSSRKRRHAAATLEGSEGRLHRETRAARISKAKSCSRSSCAATDRSAT